MTGVHKSFTEERTSVGMFGGTGGGKGLFGVMADVRNPPDRPGKGSGQSGLTIRPGMPPCGARHGRDPLPFSPLFSVP